MIIFNYEKSISLVRATGTGFALQSATNLNAPVSRGATLPAPAVVNDQFVVTNAFSTAQKFYRLFH